MLDLKIGTSKENEKIEIEKKKKKKKVTSYELEHC